jgi:hypothetical protein
MFTIILIMPSLCRKVLVRDIYQCAGAFECWKEVCDEEEDERAIGEI